VSGDNQTVALTALLVENSIPPALVMLGVVLGFTLAKRVEGRKFAWKPFLICCGMAFLGIVGSLNADGLVTAVEEIPEAQINVVKEAAPNGAAIEAMGPDKIRKLELAETQDATDRLTRIGQSARDVGAVVQVVPSKIGNVLRTTIKNSEGTVEEKAAGISGGDIVVISCTPNDRSTFAYINSMCQKNFEDDFGVQEK
jgi:ribosomal silencing factor RsfS